MRFCILRRNSRCLQKWRENRSITHSFRDKCVYVFYVEIQDDRQKCQENDLWEMSPVDSADTLEGQKFRQNRSILHRFRDKCIYVFYAEIQDGCQKWRENNFWKKLPVNSGDTLAIKNFNEIALSHIISAINVFLHFTQKFKMATKNGGKMIFGKSHQLTLLIPCLGVKHFNQILYLTPFPR